MKSLKIALLASLLLLLLIPAAARAQDVEGGFGVNLVYPPGETAKSYFWYDLGPGKSQEHALELVNNLPYALKVLIYPADCYNTQDGALAGPLFGEESKAVGKWVKLPEQEILLAPKARKRVNFTLAVPDKIESGDYFGFLFLQPSPADEKNHGEDKTKPGNASFTVKLQQRLGICLVARVPGELKSGLEVSTVEKAVDAKGQLYLLVSIRNAGNLYLKPSVAWDLKDPEGESALYQDPQETGYLLPGYPLQIKIPLTTQRPLARGEYELSVSVEYEKKPGEKQKEEKKFKIQLP